MDARREWTMYLYILAAHLLVQDAESSPFGFGGIGGNVNVGGIGGNLGLGRGGVDTGLHLGGHKREGVGAGVDVGLGGGSVDLGLGGGGVDLGFGRGGVGLGFGGGNAGRGLGGGNVGRGLRGGSVGLGLGGGSVGLGLGDGSVDLELGGGSIGGGLEDNGLKAGIDIGGTGVGGLSVGTTESAAVTEWEPLMTTPNVGLIPSDYSEGSLVVSTTVVNEATTVDTETSASDIPPPPPPPAIPIIPEVTIQPTVVTDGDTATTTSLDDTLVAAITASIPPVTTETTLADPIIPRVMVESGDDDTEDVTPTKPTVVTTEADDLGSILGAVSTTETNVEGFYLASTADSDTVTGIVTTPDTIIGLENSIEASHERDAIISTTESSPTKIGNVLIREGFVTTEKMEEQTSPEGQTTTEDYYSSTTEIYTTTDRAVAAIIPGFNDDTSASDTDEVSGSGDETYVAVSTTARTSTVKLTSVIPVYIGGGGGDDIRPTPRYDYDWVPVYVDGEKSRTRGTTSTPVTPHYPYRRTTPRHFGVPPRKETDDDTDRIGRPGGREYDRGDLDLSRILLVLLLWLGAVIVLFLIITHYDKFLRLWDYRCVCGVGKGNGTETTVFRNSYRSHYQIDL